MVFLEFGRIIMENNISNAEKIKLAAMKLFGSYGYGSTTVRMIAQEAGLSQGQIAVHYGSKEELYKNIVNDAIEISNSAIAPVKTEMDRLIEAGELNSENAWALIEKMIVDLIDYCLIPSNHACIMMLNIVLPDSWIVDTASKNFQNTILVQQELLLAQLIEAYSGKKAILRSRVISRAVNGAIVSFAEHQEFLMNDVYANEESEKALEYAKGHLKNFILNSLRHVDKIVDFTNVEK